MRNYQKLTLITAILGLIIPVIGLTFYFIANSLLPLPILGLFLGGPLIIAIIIIAINAGALFAAFRIKNTRMVGIILIACGILLFAVIPFPFNFLAILGTVLFIISGILALRYKGDGLNKVKIS